MKANVEADQIKDTDGEHTAAIRNNNTDARNKVKPPRRDWPQPNPHKGKGKVKGNRLKSSVVSATRAGGLDTKNNIARSRKHIMNETSDRERERDVGTFVVLSHSDWLLHLFSSRTVRKRCVVEHRCWRPLCLFTHAREGRVDIWTLLKESARDDGVEEKPKP